MMKTRSSAEMKKRSSTEVKKKSSADMKKRTSAEMKNISSAQMKKMSVECEVVECNFKTPTLDVEEYAAMVRHLQVLRFETFSQKLEEN